MKQIEAQNSKIIHRATHTIRRDDIYNNSFHYAIIDFVQQDSTKNLPLLTDIFKECKKRKPKERTASMPRLETI